MKDDQKILTVFFHLNAIFLIWFLITAFCLRFVSAWWTGNVASVLINQELGYEDVWEDGDVAAPFLIFALDGEKWSASRPDRFNIEKIFPVPIE